MASMVPVSSSNISEIGYDSGEQTLYVAFKDGGMYGYYGVPYDTYNGLMSASSHGSYLAAHIKDKYSYQRLR